MVLPKQQRLLGPIRGSLLVQPQSAILAEHQILAELMNVCGVEYW